MYISIKKKFAIAISIMTFILTICTLIEIPWWVDLCSKTNPAIATLIILGLCFLPGIMIYFTICGILLDTPRRRKIIEEDLDDITLLIAAYNEEEGIYDTLKSVAQQEYPCNVFVKVIDNNSNDNTKEEIYRAKRDFPQIKIEYLFEKEKGKFAALNRGLAETLTPYVITIDADTFMYKNALITLVNAITQESKNKKVGAIAGTVLVRNSRVNLLTKMQEWEYFLSISGIKRMQGLFQSTLVAQGAFSIYNTKLLQDIGGWKDSIGEDIVLTWEILSKGYNTYYEDSAITFTNVPITLKVFARQRARWARGMIEGFRHFSFKECKNKYAKFFIFCDLFLFIIDFSVTFFYIPGIILALFFQNYLIVGAMTLLLLPITLLFFSIMFMVEYRCVFKQTGLKVRKHLGGFLAYTLLYSLILSPVCVYGYIQEFLGKERKWK
jgi:biofilm PGA synthesis N-glycosyltransferase PgaC